MSRSQSVAVALLALAAAACSAAPGSTGTGDPKDGTPKSAPSGSANGDSPDAGAAVANGSQSVVTQSGTVTDFNTKQPVSGATVTAAGQTVTTGVDGSYSFTVQKGAPFALTISDDGYATLLEQTTSIEADYAAGSTTLVPESLAGILTGMFIGYDATLGVLSLGIVPTGSCASEDGSTITVSPAGTAKVAYFTGSLPDDTRTAVKGGNFPSAVIYNAQPGVPLTVTVTNATCKQAAFPITQNGVNYTGGIATQAGQVTGFARIFLQ